MIIRIQFECKIANLKPGNSYTFFNNSETFKANFIGVSRIDGSPLFDTISPHNEPIATYTLFGKKIISVALISSIEHHMGYKDYEENKKKLFALMMEALDLSDSDLGDKNFDNKLKQLKRNLKINKII